MKRIYLDNAAATPISADSFRVMADTARKFPGNPSAIYTEGKAARKVLEEARTSIAGCLSARPDEIIFTSGATEANNMAIFGVVHHARMNGIMNPHIIVSSIEHPSVLEVARDLERYGVRVDYLPVDRRGIILMKELRARITPETVLVSIMYANNEIGTIQPILDIAKDIRHARKINSKINGGVYPYFHTDAAQAVNYLDINVLKLGVDLMTVSSGKIYGPRGIALLFVKRGVKINPLVHGGEHERGLRPGTEAVSLVAGFAKALEQTCKMCDKEHKRLQKLRDQFLIKVMQGVPHVSMNGDLLHSLPNFLNLSFDGIESEALVLYLDASGIAVSGKSACKSSEGGPSHVILAIGKVENGETGAIRFSFGRETNSKDLAYVAKEIIRLAPILRRMQKNSN